MKIRKLNEINWGGDSLSMGALADVIVALDIAQNSTAPSLPDSKEFQGRCATAIVALASQILDKVERYYAPETKRFRVTYDVKRSGCHAMEVEAKDEDEAEQIALHRLEDTDEACLDGLETEIVATDVVEAVEVRG